MKNKGKTIVTLLVLLTFSMMLVGCKKKEIQTEQKEEEKPSEVEEVMVEIPPVSSEGILYAVVIEKGKNKITVQSDGGQTLQLALNNETDLKELGEELAEGMAIRAEYKGKLRGATTGEIEVKKIMSSDKLPKVSKEALEVVGKIITSTYDRNLEVLAELCDYPLLVDRGEKIRINSKQEFLSQSKADIFEKDLIRQISETNPFMLTEYPQGFLLGKSIPNLIVSNTKKGWKISAFRYK